MGLDRAHSAVYRGSNYRAGRRRRLLTWPTEVLDYAAASTTLSKEEPHQIPHIVSG